MAEFHVEQTRKARVRRGESPSTVADLPPLRTAGPACGPVWRLFDGEVLPDQVKRQAHALCVRCPLTTDCSRKIT